MRRASDDGGAEAQSVYGRGDEREVLCADTGREREVFGDPGGRGGVCYDLGREVESVSYPHAVVTLRGAHMETAY